MELSVLPCKRPYEELVDRRYCKKIVKKWVDPDQDLSNVCHEFGAHGGVNVFTDTIAWHDLGPEHHFYIYNRHFDSTTNFEWAVPKTSVVFTSRAWMSSSA